MFRCESWILGGLRWHKIYLSEFYLSWNTDVKSQSRNIASAEQVPTLQWFLGHLNSYVQDANAFA